jgi:hypothetical protein
VNPYLLAPDVIFDEPQQIPKGEGFLQVIHSTHLHGLQVAAHVDAARHHQNCPVTVHLQGSIQHLPPFKGLAALTHQHESKLLSLQVVQTTLDGVARRYFETLAFKKHAIRLQVLRLLVHQEDFVLRHLISELDPPLSNDLLIPMKVVSDSDLIPVAGSDAMVVTVGAKRRWRSYRA